MTLMIDSRMKDILRKQKHLEHMSCRSRGVSGGSLNPPLPVPHFKMSYENEKNGLIETKLFHFHRIFKKNERKSAKPTPKPLYI